MASKPSKKIESEIIYESALLKRGKYQNTFKEKWFVLLQNNMLIYYSSEQKAKSKDKPECDGTIALKDVNNFSVIHNKNDKKTLSLPPSTYRQIELTRKSSVIQQIRITKQTANTSTDSFAFQLDTAQRSYILGSKNSKEFRQWIFYLENMIFGGIIYSGYLMKQGGKWKSWKKRWFHLDKNVLLLKYYETQKLKIWKGQIDLALVTNLCRGDKETNGKDFSIELNTADRVWILAANNQSNQSQWIEKIKHVIDTHNQIDEKQTDMKNDTHIVDVTVPKVKGVRFADNNNNNNNNDNNNSKYGIDYNLDNEWNAEESSVVSVSSVVGHERARTRISIVITSADQEEDEDDSDYSSSNSSYKYRASLDEYDGGSLLNNSSLNPIDTDDDELYKGFVKFEPEKESHAFDHIVPDFDNNRFGHSSQISVEKWHCDSSDYDHEIVDENSIIIKRTPSPSQTPMKHRINTSKSKGYEFVGLKTQFINVHDIDLKTANNDYEDEDEDDNDNERKEEYRYCDDQSRHIKSKSSMKTVQFDERFRKIFKKKKKEIDIVQAEESMILQWNQCMIDIDIDNDAAEMKWNDMKTDVCVGRVAIILQFYHLWIYNVCHKQGISEIVDKLPHFDFIVLLNDFYHIIREYQDQFVYLKLFFLQQTNIETDMENCLMFLRCNRDKVRMSVDFLLRRSLYFLSSTKVKGENERYEVVLQQILDSIYCFVLYGEYFSANDSGNNLCQTINIYEKGRGREKEKKKRKNILYKYKSDRDLQLGNKFCSLIKYENELAVKNGNNKNNIFGVNMRYGTRIEWYYMQRYRPFFATMKEELMNHSSFEISTFQWHDMILKADLFKKTFIGKKLLAKKPNENERNLCENRQILDIHIIALIFYSHFNKLKKSLLNSYHMLPSPNTAMNGDGDGDIDREMQCRLKHYNYFFHFGRLILESVKVFGDNLYEDEWCANRCFYHGVNMVYENVLKMEKFAFNTYGAISVTSLALVSFLYNDNYQQSVLQLDLNGGTLFQQNIYCLDLSFISDCNYEKEYLLDNGGLCLGIRNIISLKLHKNANNYYLWSESIFLLRIIIGDIYWKLNEKIDSYFRNTLCKNEIICDRLLLLIVNEMEFDHNDITDTDSNNEIPKYIGKIFHSYCNNMYGYCYIRYQRILHLPTPLQHIFLVNQYECINCRFLLQLLPNINFIYGYNFIFDDTFCKHICNYLTDHKQNKNRLMYIQFEQFHRQKQINKLYFKEIIAVIQQYNNFSTQWNVKKSTKWKCIKFENKQLMNKYTVPINTIDIISKPVNNNDKNNINKNTDQ